MITVRLLEIQGSDRSVANAARTTVWMDDKEGPVPEGYMRKMYLCEHSPIRAKRFVVEVVGVPYWIAMHFVRHKVGIEHFVSTLRDDRGGQPRNKMSQDAPVIWRFVANAAAVIAISRKRLCMQAHRETQEVWRQVLAAIGVADPELVQACVPECIYRGHCYEYKTCGWHLTEQFQRELDRYRRGIND